MGSIFQQSIATATVETFVALKECEAADRKNVQRRLQRTWPESVLSAVSVSTGCPLEFFFIRQRQK